MREIKADYVIGLKDNQPTLAADMSDLLDEENDCVFQGFVTDLHVTTETARGGVEPRDVRVLEIPQDSPHRIIWKDIFCTVAGMSSHYIVAVRSANERSFAERTATMTTHDISLNRVRYNNASSGPHTNRTARRGNLRNAIISEQPTPRRRTACQVDPLALGHRKHAAWGPGPPHLNLAVSIGNSKSGR